MYQPSKEVKVDNATGLYIILPASWQFHHFITNVVQNWSVSFNMKTKQHELKISLTLIIQIYVTCLKLFIYKYLFLHLNHISILSLIKLSLCIVVI